MMKKIFGQAFALCGFIALAIVLLIPALAQTTNPIQGNNVSLSSPLILNVVGLNTCKFWFAGSLANPVNFTRGVVTPPTSPASTTSGITSTNSISQLYTINLASTKFLEFAQSGGGGNITYLCTTGVPDDSKMNLGPSPTPLPVAVQNTPAPTPPATSGSGVLPQAFLPSENSYTHCLNFGFTPNIGSSLISMLSCDAHNNLNVDVQAGSATIVGGYIGFSPHTSLQLASSATQTCTLVSAVPTLIVTVSNNATTTQPALNFFNNSGCTGNPLHSITLGNQQTINANWYFDTDLYTTLGGAPANTITVDFGI